MAWHARVQVVLAYIPCRGPPRDPSATVLLELQAQASRLLTAAALGQGAGLHRRISVLCLIRAKIMHGSSPSTRDQNGRILTNLAVARRSLWSVVEQSLIVH